MLLNSIPHSLVKVDIAKGETRSDEIKKLNRRGKVISSSSSSSSFSSFSFSSSSSSSSSSLLSLLSHNSAHPKVPFIAHGDFVLDESHAILKCPPPPHP